MKKLAVVEYCRENDLQYEDEDLITEYESDNVCHKFLCDFDSKLD